MKNIVKFEGGIGNQLFQYAHARYLQLKYGGSIGYDLHAFNSKQIRSLSLHNFNLPADNQPIESNLYIKVVSFILRVVSSFCSHLRARFPKLNSEKFYRLVTRLGVYHQIRTVFFAHDIKPLLPFNYIVGNWISPKFFEGIDTVLREEFTVKTPLSVESIKMLDQIRQSNSVCVHVRLGDYLAPEWKDKLYICTEEYYQKGIDYISSKVENPVFFVFSNRHKDIEWIKENYKLKGNIVYVDLSNPDYADLKLMYSCKHFIMSNSTYSWWAQYLGAYKEKIVVAPSRFNNYPTWDMGDLYLDNWKLIKV